MSGVSNSFNWCGVALRDPKGDNPARPTVFIKYSSHDSNIEEKTEEDKSNIGGATTVIGFDRTQVSSSPEIEDKIRYKEGWELFSYCALGGSREPVNTETVTVNNGSASETIKRYTYQFAPENQRESLPKLTEVKGFNMWTTDLDENNKALKPFIMDNLKCDEFTVTLEAKGDIKTKVKMMGDAPVFNVADANMTKTLLPKSRNVKADNVSVYYGNPDVEASDFETLKTKLVTSSCVQKIEVSIKNNLEDAECFNTKFGKAGKDEGAFECEISGTMELNRKTAREQGAWITGDVDGNFATSDPYIRQFLVCLEGVPILDSKGNPVKKEDGTVLDYKTYIKLPKVHISEWKPSEDGDDIATVEFKGKTILTTGATDGNVNVAPCSFTIMTDVPKLQYPSEKITGETKLEDVCFVLPAE